MPRKKSFSVVDGAIEPHEEPTRQVRREKLAEGDRAETIARRLVDASDDALGGVPMTDRTRRAVRAARTIHAHGARRRQMLYLAKLLRSEDLGAIEDALGAREGIVEAREQLLRKAERWRTRLLDEGDAALEALLEARPEVDRQRLRTLIRTARRDPPDDRARKASRQLFAAVRGLLEEGDG